MSNNNKSIELYCLNCGKVVVSKYRGEIMGLVHMCKDYPYHGTTFNTTLEDIRTVRNECKVLTTINAPLINASLFFRDSLNFARCGECKTKEEHIEKLIKDYLGDHYTDFIPENPTIAGFKRKFIEDLKKIANI